MLEEGLTRLGKWEDELWLQKFEEQQLALGVQLKRGICPIRTHTAALHMRAKWERRLTMAQDTVDKDDTGALALVTSRKRKGKERADV